MPKVSNFSGYGTLSANGSTDWISVAGFVTCVATGTWGGGTITWKLRGVDGNEISIYAGSNNTTEQAYTANHMVNFYVGTDVQIRGTLTGATAPDLDWQIMSSSINRGMI